jgi:hypothetical protein
MNSRQWELELDRDEVAVGDQERVRADAMTVAQWRQALAVTERWPDWPYADSQRRIAVNVLRLAAERGLSDDEIALPRRPT